MQFTESLKSRIVPVPQNFDFIEGECLSLTKDSKFVLTVPEKVQWASETAVEKIKDYFVSHCGNESLLGGKGAIKVLLQIKKSPKKIPNEEEGYALEIKGKSIKITGFGDSGLLYGVITLRQLLKWDEKGATLPALKIFDWPDYKLRGIKEESRYGSNLMELSDWYDLIDDLAEKKFNTLNLTLYSCWNVQYDGRVSEYIYVPIEGHPELNTPMVIKYYSPKKGSWVRDEKLPPIFEKDLLTDICKYLKKNGMSLFPAWNSLGHNTLIPAKIPEISAKEEDGTPSLNCFCTSNKKTYEFLFDCFDQIIDRYMKPYGFTSFSIGMDEVYDKIAANSKDIFKKRAGWCRCEKCRDKDRGDRFVEHAVKLVKHLSDQGMEHIGMAADMIPGDGPNTVGELGEKLLSALEKIGLKDKMFLDFWNYVDTPTRIKYKNLYPQLGIPRYVAPWDGYYVWAFILDSVPNINLLANMAEKDGADGVLAYSMYDKSNVKNYDALSDYFWNFKGTGTVEDFTERFIERNFPNHSGEAKRGFKLLTSLGQQFDNPGFTFVRNMLQQLCGYWHSYVKSGQPYPQPIFAYGLKYLMTYSEKTNSTFESRRNLLLALSSEAKVAKEIFTEIAKDKSVNHTLADRYAYECDNFLCIYEDWLTICEMYDLSLLGRYQEIVPLCRSREKARLELMTRLENTKEKYIVESLAMRIQTTFMVTFRDLADYIEKNPDKTPDLLSEMKEVFSKDYFDLR